MVRSFFSVFILCICVLMLSSCKTIKTAFSEPTVTLKFLSVSTGNKDQYIY